MTLTDDQLEKLEKEYFDHIFYYLKSNENRMMEGLKSKEGIRDDWWEKFLGTDKKRQVSDFARGAERIFYWLLTTLWIPNSSPIGSDLFFETYNAFLHIDIKTARSDNTSDYKGKVTLGKNQTSYDAEETHTGAETQVNPNLPEYYHKDGEEKPCLTYTIQMIHDPETFEIIAILLISVPNGQLYEVYGTNIVGAGKSKDESMRFEYKNEHRFMLLNGNPSRVKFLYFNEDSAYSKEDITTISEIT